MQGVYSLCTAAFLLQHMLLSCFTDGIGLLQSCCLPGPSFRTIQYFFSYCPASMKETEISGTLVPTSFGKEATQQMKETDNPRGRLKP